MLNIEKTLWYIDRRLGIAACVINPATCAHEQRFVRGLVQGVAVRTELGFARVKILGISVAKGILARRADCVRAIGHDQRTST